MADVRFKAGVKLVDPTTDANQLNILAEDAAASGGEFGIQILAVRNDAAAAKTSTDGDFSAIAVDSAGRVGITALGGTFTVDTELPAAGALADATANPTTTSVGVFPHIWDSVDWERQRSVINAQDTVGDGIAAAGILGQLDDVSTGTVTENQFAPVRISTRRALLVEGVASGTNVNVNVAASTTITVDTEITAPAALGDAESNATAVGEVGVRLMGYNGTTWDRVRTANTGRLQVDVISGGSGTPTSPKTSQATSASLAAGASVDLDSTQITSAKTGKLAFVMAGSSVALKIVLKTVLNNVATAIWTWFQPPSQSEPILLPHVNYIQQAESATAGFDGFRVTVTNMDNAAASDVYVNYAWDEI